VSYVAVIYAYGAWQDVDFDQALYAGVVWVALLCVPLVFVAYSGGERRWCHFVLWPALGLLAGLIPLIWLPWRIVSRRGSSQGGQVLR
jgi:hypothetical protein